MSTISLSNVSFSYDASNMILDGVSIAFSDSERVAIVGDNGAGKTTVLKLLAGDIVPDHGHVSRGASVYMTRQINAATSKSGGERQSAELARAFDSGAAILLLDEPTNNLDAEARRRFFNNLASYPFGAVIVSHDRELLRQVDRIIEIRQGKIRVWGGNYDFWIAGRCAEQENIFAKYTAAQKEISRLGATMNIAQNTRQHHEVKQRKEIANTRRSRIAANALKGQEPGNRGQAACDNSTEIKRPNGITPGIVSPNAGRQNQNSIAQQTILQQGVDTYIQLDIWVWCDDGVE